MKFAQGLIVHLKEKLRANLDRAILLQLWQAHNLSHELISFNEVNNLYVIVDQHELST